MGAHLEIQIQGGLREEQALVFFMCSQVILMLVEHVEKHGPGLNA